MKKTTLLTTVAIVGGLAGQLAADSGETRNVVISTDISMGLDCVNVFGSKPKPADPDDAWALAWALEESGWNVLAVVVSFGNCSCEGLDVGCTELFNESSALGDECGILQQGIEVAEWVVEQSGLDVPVLRGSANRFAPNGMAPAGTMEAVDIIRKSSEPVALIGIGPATDPAYILRDLAATGDLDQVDGLYLEMGQYGEWAGQVGFPIGDTRVSDYNFRADTGSVRSLLDLRADNDAFPALTLVPYNAIREGLVTEFMLDAMVLSGRPAATRIAEDSRAWATNWVNTFSEPGFHLWDLICCFAAADGMVFLEQPVTAEIECIDGKPALTLTDANIPGGIICAYHLTRIEPPYATKPLELGEPADPYGIPDENAIAQIGMLGCMALDGPPPCPGDLNNDGMVDGADLGLLLSLWGTCL